MYVVFGEFLGLDYSLVPSCKPGYGLQLGSQQLELPDMFLSNAQENWLGSATLPVMPIACWDIAQTLLRAPLVDQPLPVLFGKPEIEISDQFVRIGVDILGTVFFMLSRYEEVVFSARDEHDRFPAAASIARRAGFLDRPIVDEYVEVLWAAMKRLWPALERKQRQSRTLVSCDVDHPYVRSSNSVTGVIKRLGGDLMKRHSLSMAARSLSIGMRTLQGDFSSDPYFTALDWIMDVNEKAGNRVAFYFITAHSHATLDGFYCMNEPLIRGLLRRIAARGHEIGLHASYNSYQDADQTCREAVVLREIMAEEDIHQEGIGGRQHFLRWDTAKTARNWEVAEMSYDSTLSYADYPGFRCGTCCEYPMYDLIERRPLHLRQRPLVLMECSVIADRYMGMGYSDKTLELMMQYKKTCQKFNGDFTLLWHNSHFLNAEDRSFYQKLIR
ncbi:MAG: polysaccharide deacetylase family protein [Sulfuritalea sp.]|nr:polysaccharide deacetylase family protein [Sulfuritalea sp.]